MEMNRSHAEDLPFVLLVDQQEIAAESKIAPVRAGDVCPNCRKGHLVYNGLLNLECDQCKFTLSGCFT